MRGVYLSLIPAQTVVVVDLLFGCEINDESQICPTITGAYMWPFFLAVALDLLRTWLVVLWMWLVLSTLQSDDEPSI